MAATLAGTTEARRYRDYALKSLGTAHHPRKRRNPRRRTSTYYSSRNDVLT